MVLLGTLKASLKLVLLNRWSAARWWVAKVFQVSRTLLLRHLILVAVKAAVSIQLVFITC